jgi:hypothetical protein
MAARAAFKQADVTRALRAAKAAGLKLSGYKIDVDGAIVVTLADGMSPVGRNPLDRLLEP